MLRYSECDHDIEDQGHVLHVTIEITVFVKMNSIVVKSKHINAARAFLNCLSIDEHEFSTDSKHCKLKTGWFLY